MIGNMARRRQSKGIVTKADIERRRAEIARLLGEGLNAGEIYQAMRNPVTKEPYALSTIYLDLEALEHRWKQEGLLETNKRIERQLSRIQAGYDMAVERRDLKAMAKFVELEIKLTGTAAPDKLQVEHQGVAVYLPEIKGDE